MNLLTAIAVYATLCRHEGVPYRFTGPAQAADVLYQVTDARLLARATVWAGTAPQARDEVFNVTNGDVFRWRDMSARIAAHFDLDIAPGQQLRLAEHMPGHEAMWAAIVATHDLKPIPYRDVAAWDFADAIFHSSWDNVSSTVKLRTAGFADCIDTEQMFVELFDDLADRRVIPRAR
jgi:nucleoside-diphosphate-sugar epimerase